MRTKRKALHCLNITNFFAVEKRDFMAMHICFSIVCGLPHVAVIMEVN